MLRRRQRRGALGVLGIALAAMAAFPMVVCTQMPAAAATKRVPLPAGPRPSKLAKMPCQREAQEELADALGVKGTVGKTAWVDHRYSCVYRYANGTFHLSIQEESSWTQTLGYFHGLGATMGDVRRLGNLGQGAFQTADGSVVVRKDWKILLVNIAGLPARFGVPQTSAADVAVTIADVILGCWTGD